MVETHTTQREMLAPRPVSSRGELFYLPIGRLYSASKERMSEDVVLKCAQRLHATMRDAGLVYMQGTTIKEYKQALYFLLYFDVNPFDPKSSARLRRFHRSWIANVAYRGQYAPHTHIDAEFVIGRLEGVTGIFKGVAPKGHLLPELFTGHDDDRDAVWTTEPPATRFAPHDPRTPFFLDDGEPLPLTAYGVYYIYSDTERPRAWDELEDQLNLMLTTLSRTLRPTTALGHATPQATADKLNANLQWFVGLFEEHLKRFDRIQSEIEIMEVAIVQNAVEDHRKLAKADAMVAEERCSRSDAYAQLCELSWKLDASEEKRTGDSCKKKQLRQANEELKRCKIELHATKDRLRLAGEDAERLKTAQEKLEKEAAARRDLERQLSEAKQSLAAVRTELDATLADVQAQTPQTRNASSQTDARAETTRSECVDAETQASPQAVWSDKINMRMTLEDVMRSLTELSSTC